MNPFLLTDIPLWSAPFGIKLLECIEYRKGITALDIGFGTGFPLIEIAMRLGEGSIVIGIDPNREMVELVNAKIAELPFHLADPIFQLTPMPVNFHANAGKERMQKAKCEERNVKCEMQYAEMKLIQGNAESIPLPSASVDLITSNNGINNAGDIPAVIAECARVMRPGGQFVQTMNTAGTMNEFYLHFQAVLAERGMTAEIEKMRRHVAQKRPPVDWIVSLLKKNDFTVRQVIHDQFNYRFADGTAMFGHPFIRMAFVSAWRELVPEDRREEVFGEVERRLNDIASKENGLQMSVPFVVLNSYRI